MGDRVGPQVGSGQTFCRQSWVESGQRFAGSGRVQEKWPVDNSVIAKYNQSFYQSISGSSNPFRNTRAYIKSSGIHFMARL